MGKRIIKTVVALAATGALLFGSAQAASAMSCANCTDDSGCEAADPGGDFWGEFCA